MGCVRAVRAHQCAHVPRRGDRPPKLVASGGLATLTHEAPPSCISRPACTAEPNAHGLLATKCCELEEAGNQSESATYRAMPALASLGESDEVVDSVFAPVSAFIG